MKKAAIIIIGLLVMGFKQSDYSIVYDKEVALNKSEKARLTLYDPAIEQDMVDENGGIVGVIKITSGRDGKIDYIFDDRMDTTGPSMYKDWPVSRWYAKDLNNDPPELIDMCTVNVMDTDNNGQNEIFVYGEASHGSGWVSKVFSFEESNEKIVRKYPVMTGITNDEIYYYSPKNIFIISDFIWRPGEARVGGMHNYIFYILEAKNGCKEKLLIDTTKEKINAENEAGIIRPNFEDIIKKYDIYKKGEVSPKEKEMASDFVIKFWDANSAKNAGSLGKYYGNTVEYFSKKCKAADVIIDKKKMLDKFKGIDFKVDRFLVYKNNKNTVVEYDKEYASQDKDGKVRSRLVLEGGNGNYKISTEEDMVIYRLSTDTYN